MSINMKMEGNLKEAGAYNEFEKWKKLEIAKYVTLVIVVLVGAFGIFPAEMLVRGEPGKALLFYKFLADIVVDIIPNVNSNLFSVFGASYGSLFKQMIAEKLFPPIPLLVWIALLIAVPVAFKSANKYRKTPNIFGDARWSTEDDIEAMAKRDLIGFEDSKQNPKGLFILGKFKDRLLRMGETLSVLLLAPPGTGKSVGFIVPSIVEMDEVCQFVHDQKPELWDMTAGYRGKIGPCFLLKWAARDEPEGRLITEEQMRMMDPSLLVLDKDKKPKRDEATGLFRTLPVYYPSWNPLSPKCMPPLGPSRDMYLQRLSETLCPDGGTSEKFWSSKARQALTGLTHFLCAKVEAALDPDLKWKWDGIPEQWHGREPSYPMLVDWIAYGSTAFPGEDPVRDFLKSVIDEAHGLEAMFTQKRGIRPMNRAIVEISGLMNNPDKTRQSIMTTFDEAMGPFKMESVRQRTSASDLAFYQLRGIPTDEAQARENKLVEEARLAGRAYRPRYEKNEWRPVTIYVSVDLENAKAFAAITSIFIDSANAYLVSNGPNAVDEQGQQVGPYPFSFLIDEAPQLGKLDTIINGPAVGRSKKISYTIVGQDFGQFEQKYSKPEVETLKSTTAIKIILTQNNENTAKQVSEMAGRMTFKKQSFSDKPRKGLEGFIFGKGQSASESWESVEFLRPSFLMSIPQDKHVVLVQNYMNRPVFCDTPKFFLETKKRKGRGAIADKVLNLRKMEGPKPGAPMPASLMEQAAERRRRFDASMKRIHDAADQAVVSGHAPSPVQTAQKPVAPVVEDDGRRLVILTPDDVAALARDTDGRREYFDGVRPFFVYETKLEPGDEEVPPPADDEVKAIYDAEDVAKIIGTSRFWIFNAEALGKFVNQELLKVGRRPIPEEQAVFVQTVAESLGERSTSDWWLLGAHGGPALDTAASGAEPNPVFCVNWACEVISFLIATDMRKHIYDDPDGFIEEIYAEQHAGLVSDVLGGKTIDEIANSEPTDDDDDDVDTKI